MDQTYKVGNNIKEASNIMHMTNHSDGVVNEVNTKYNKSHVFVEHVRRHIEGGQLTWKDVIDEANVIVAAVSIHNI